MKNEKNKNLNGYWDGLLIYFAIILGLSLALLNSRSEMSAEALKYSFNTLVGVSSIMTPIVLYCYLSYFKRR